MKNGLRSMRFTRRTWIILGLVIACIAVIVTLLIVSTRSVPLGVTAASSSTPIKSSAVSGHSEIKSNLVVNSCYSFTLPLNYAISDGGDGANPNRCDVSINPSDTPGVLNYIDISPKSIKVGADPVATLKKLLTQSGTAYDQVSPITVDGLPGAKALIAKNNEPTDGLSQTDIILPAPGPKAWTQDGQTIYSYLITAYTSDANLQNAFDTVVNSIKFKSP